MKRLIAILALAAIAAFALPDDLHAFKRDLPGRYALPGLQDVRVLQVLLGQRRRKQRGPQVHLRTQAVRVETRSRGGIRALHRQ